MNQTTTESDYQNHVSAMGNMTEIIETMSYNASELLSGDSGEEVRVTTRTKLLELIDVCRREGYYYGLQQASDIITRSYESPLETYK